MVHSVERLEGAKALLEQLYDPADSFIIHVDSKVENSVFLAYKHAMTICANILFIDAENRVRGGWGGMSLVEIELVLLRAALHFPFEWENVILLDGASWPMGTSATRQLWLEKYRDISARGGVGQPPGPLCTWQDNSRDRPQGYCMRSPSRCLNENCTEMSLTPNHAPVRKQSQWMILNKATVHFLTDPKVEAEWKPFWQLPHVSAPDELYFVTMQYAMPNGPIGSLPEPVQVIWAGKNVCKTYPATEGAHPCLLGLADLPALEKSEKPFVRKLLANQTDLQRALTQQEPKSLVLPPVVLSDVS